MKALTAMIPSLRRLVTRSGESQLTAYLHMCIAVLEGETGHFDEARRHTDVAESLLEISDNNSLRSANLVNKGCLAILNCHLREATSSFHLAKGLTRRTGDPFIASRVDGNLAHIHLFSGELEQARELLERTLREGTFGKLGEVGALDGLARIHLVGGDLEACEGCFREIDSYKTKYEAHPSMYHVRWAGLTRARLLLRQRQFAACADLLSRLARETATVSDRPFGIALEQLAALADCNLNDESRSSRHILAADRAGALRVKELQPQHYFVAARVVNKHDRQLARQLKQRASRVWDAHGVVSTRVELDEEGIDLDTARRELKAARTTPPTPPRTIETITNALAAALDLAHSPRLFGMELLAIVRGLDCSTGAHLVETREEAPEDNDQQAVIVLGSEGGKLFSLICPLPTEPVKAVLLGDVLRLGAAGIALEAARRDERNRSALWPASPVEEQAGALFIAEEMQGLLSMVRRIASTNVPVLITGETGTGKEVLARTLHGYSNRAGKPFIPFNCSATPRDMLDAQLFGHRKGAFTGATENFPGVIRAATGGTLFLDEIGETTLDLQPKLLRFLDAGEVHPIGDTQPTRVDVRVIAATNADLDALVAQGRFRDDLFYRLNIVTLHVPPLRARREEIPVLAQHYLDKHSLEAGKRGLRLAEETVEYLVLYKWPGNVRQLANEMRRMSALADNGAVLMPEHLSAPIAASRKTVPASERALDPTEVVVRLDQPLPAATAHLERTMIQHALKKSGGHMEDTAAMLGLSRKGLYLKRQRLGLDASTDGADGMPA
jgi:DNA-binding NtrC family response regulator